MSLRTRSLAVALLGGLCGTPAAAATVAGADLARTGCPDAPRIQVRLGSEVVAIPRPALVSATGPGLDEADPLRGCAGRPVEAAWVEVEGPEAGRRIVLSPAMPTEHAVRTAAALRAMRGGPSCRGSGRMICPVTETQEGRAVTVRYVFDPDERSSAGDGAPAHARCLPSQGRTTCFVDLEDPRGFRATMAYPVDSFRSSQVMSIASSVRAKLTESSVVPRRGS